MATQKERPGSWKARGLIKRDFQHDHSGPEEMPHAPNKKYKKKHVHVWERGPKYLAYEGETYIVYRYHEYCIGCANARERRDWRYKYQ